MENKRETLQINVLRPQNINFKRSDYTAFMKSIDIT